MKVAWDVLPGCDAVACVCNDAGVQPYLTDHDFPVADYVGLHLALWELFDEELPGV